MSEQSGTATTEQDEPTVTVRNAIRLTGATYRQIDYWIRTARIIPAVRSSGSGEGHRLSQRNLREIRALAQVMACVRGQGLQRTLALVVAAADDPVIDLDLGYGVRVTVDGGHAIAPEDAQESASQGDQP